MKIALTHVDLPNEAKGGVAHQVHYLSNVLAGRGHDVTMFTFSPAFAECCYQVRRLQPPAPRLRRFQSFLFARALARTDFSGFDLIHANGDSYLLRPGSRPPLVRTFYGSAKDEAKSAVRLRRRVYQRALVPLEALDARRADVCVGISQATRARIPAVSRIIGCGVDLSHFRPGGEKTAVPAILFVGTAGGRKRGQFLADVFGREVRSRFPDAQLWTVSDRPLVGQGIVNYGRVPLETLADLYRRAWVFCLPSTYEGFGVPYIEAMASGTVAVASPNAGAREVLAGGGDAAAGVIANDDDLGAVLGDLLADADRRQTYANRALARAAQFSWARVAEQYENVYADLVGAPARKRAAA